MEKLSVKSRVLLSLLALKDDLPQDGVHIERIHVLDQRQPDTVAISMLPIFPSLSIPPGTMWCSQMMTLPPWEQRLRWLPLGAMVPPRFPRPVPPPGAPPVPPRCAVPPRRPPVAPWCPPRASLGDPLGAARCRPVPSVARSLFTCMAARSARAPNETNFSFPVVFASSARATKILPQNVRGRNRFSGCVRGRFQIFLVRSENLLYS